VEHGRVARWNTLRKRHSPKHHQVLDHFFSKVVVDPVHVLLLV
jgi:hypothetical protein